VFDDTKWMIFRLYLASKVNPPAAA